MVYTSLFSAIGLLNFVNEKNFDNLIYYCAKNIINVHGKAKAAIDLGFTSYGVFRSRLNKLLSLERIKKEVELCLGAGMERIRIFAIDDIILNFRSWIEVLKSVQPVSLSKKHVSSPGTLYSIYRKALLPKGFFI